MDLRQLSALVAVADEGSFSAAATALHTVQSNVSTHIARLERELNAVLVDRGAGRLTEEGKAVANRARRIKAELDALVADGQSELDAAVKAGTITQAQADAEKANLTQRATDQANGSFRGGARH